MFCNGVRTCSSAMAMACWVLVAGCEYASDATVLVRVAADDAAPDAASVSPRDAVSDAPSDAGDAGSGVPAIRLAALNRGLEIVEWMGGAQYNRNWFSTADLATLKAQGVRHLRIAFAMSQLWDNQSSPAVLNTTGLSNFDEILDQVLAQGMAVVVHPAQTNPRAWTDSTYAAKLETFWRALTAHLSGRSPEQLFLKLEFNPEAMPASDWYQEQETLMRAVRAVDPRRTLLVTPNAFTNDGVRDSLTAATESVVALDNVVYDFGFFAPITFTHQGADWRANEPWLVNLHDLPYPSSPSACAPFLGAIDASALMYAQTYCDSNWGADALAAQMAPLFHWATSTGRAVACGGFGVYKPHVSAASRAQWLTDVRAALESAGVPWAIHDVGSGFSVLDYANGRRTIEPMVVSALGLTTGP